MMKARLVHPEWDDSLVWLTRLYAGYYVEEATRLRNLNVPGYPLEWRGRTALLWLGDTVEPDGFVFVDEGGRDERKTAIELLYVRPEMRRRGLITWWIGELRNGVGYGSLTIKAPLSPAGRAMSERFRLSVDEPTVEENAIGKQAGEEAREHVKAGIRNCVALGHRRGNPSMPCQKCLRHFGAQVAAAMVMTKCMEIMNAREQTGSYWPWLTPDRQARYLDKAV